uniref:Uncharacterized protein n=1 Tax=Triticum urartu TaxID=4572 RepID=A0A8R7PZ71_TRIUA
MPGGVVLLLDLRDVLRLTGRRGHCRQNTLVLAPMKIEERTHTESRCLITVFVCCFTFCGNNRERVGSCVMSMSYRAPHL